MLALTPKRLLEIGSNERTNKKKTQKKPHTLRYQIQTKTVIQRNQIRSGDQIRDKTSMDGGLDTKAGHC